MAGEKERTKPNQYFDRYFNVEAAKIWPGEYFATNRDLMLVTVLGSCVAVCLRDVVHGIAGLNHFMLPDIVGEHVPGHVGAQARYGAYAMEALINEMFKLGAERRYLEAKAFGGGNMLRMASASVGQRNSDFIVNYLRTEGIPLVAHDLLGHHPRKVYFFAGTGKVKVKRIARLNNDTILQRELEYRSELLHRPYEGEVTLFDDDDTTRRKPR